MDQAVKNTVSTSDNVILFHADGIKTAWNKSVAAFVETGQLLLEAKKAMSGTRKWLQLFDPKVGALPFGVDTAERLMRIAKNKVLTNSANWRNLPPSIRTLDVLSKDTKRLEGWLADGTITADTELKQAEFLVRPKKPTNAKEAAVETNTKATVETNEVQRAVQALYTMATTATADWTNVDVGMLRDLVEELQGRLDANEAIVAEAKVWDGNAPNAMNK